MLAVTNNLPSVSTSGPLKASVLDSNLKNKPQLFLVPLPSSVNNGTLCLCRKIYWTKDACIYYTYSPLPKNEADQIMRCSSSVSISVVTGKNLLTSVNGKFIGVQQIHGFLTFGGPHVLLNQATPAVKPTATVAPNRIGTANPQKRKHTVLATPSLPVKTTKSTPKAVMNVKVKDIPKLTKQVSLPCPKEHVPQPRNPKLTRTNKAKKSTGPQPHLKVKFAWNSRWVSVVNGTHSENKDQSETVTAVTKLGNKKPSESMTGAPKSDMGQTKSMTTGSKSENKEQSEIMTAITKSENKVHMKTKTSARTKSDKKQTKTRARTKPENKKEAETMTRARTKSKKKEHTITLTRKRFESGNKVQTQTMTRARTKSENKKQTEAVIASVDLPKLDDLRFKEMLPRVKLTRLGFETLKRLGCNTTSPLYKSLLSNASRICLKNDIPSEYVKSKIVERRSYRLTSLTKHPDLKHIPTNDKVAYLKELLKSQRELLGM